MILSDCLKLEFVISPVAAFGFAGQALSLTSG